METANGEWFISGCSEDDPQCIHTAAELSDMVQRLGFLPLFANEIQGFSVEEHTISGNWWTDDPDKDPWIWRQILASHPDIAYGKFFGKKAGFISKEWFPVMANYRRNGYDFDALCDDELVPYRNRKLMEAFAFDENLNSLELLSFEAKQKAGFGKDGQKNFEGVLTELQMQTYLVMSAFRRKKNKKGQEYGWSIAALETPETKWGYDYIAGGYHEEPAVSWEKIIGQVKKNFPEAEDRAIQKVLGIRYPGVPAAAKETIRSQAFQLPYPEGLLTVLDAEMPLNEDQAEGLQYVIENLNAREREIICLRFEEHFDFSIIAERCGSSVEKVKDIQNRAVKKMKKAENASYYREGYIKTLISLQEKKEQKERKVLDKVSDITDETEKTGILQLSVYDLELSVQTTNCLISEKIYTLGELLAVLDAAPKKLRRIRGIGPKGYADIIKKLEEQGIMGVKNIIADR